MTIVSGCKRIDNRKVIREITTTTSQYLRRKTEETFGTTNLTGIEIRNLGNHKRNHLSSTTTGNRRTTTNLKRKRIDQTSHVSTATRKDIMPTHAQRKRRLSLPQHGQFSKGQHTERNPWSDRQLQTSKQMTKKKNWIKFSIEGQNTWLLMLSWTDIQQKH